MCDSTGSKPSHWPFPRSCLCSGIFTSRKSSSIASTADGKQCMYFHPQLDSESRWGHLPLDPVPPHSSTTQLLVTLVLIPLCCKKHSLPNPSPYSHQSFPVPEAQLTGVLGPWICVFSGATADRIPIDLFLLYLRDLSAATPQPTQHSYKVFQPECRHFNFHVFFIPIRSLPVHHS